MATHENRLEHYLSLNYRIEIERDEEGDFVATVPLLPGCIADGGTAEEAAAHIQDAKTEWLTARLEAGLPIPEPQIEFSGRWVIRTSSGLHRKIAECAERESVSINQFCNNVLSEAVGYRHFVSQSCKIFVNPQPAGRYQMFVAFGNLVTGGLIWQQGSVLVQQDITRKPVELTETVELRA